VGLQCLPLFASGSAIPIQRVLQHPATERSIWTAQLQCVEELVGSGSPSQMQKSVNAATPYMRPPFDDLQTHAELTRCGSGTLSPSSICLSISRTRWLLKLIRHMPPVTRMKTSSGIWPKQPGSAIALAFLSLLWNDGVFCADIDGLSTSPMKIFPHALCIGLWVLISIQNEMLDCWPSEHTSHRLDWHGSCHARPGLARPIRPGPVRARLAGVVVHSALMVHLARSL
jgi:hypothetical protein